MGQGSAMTQWPRDWVRRFLMRKVLQDVLFSKKKEKKRKSNAYDMRPLYKPQTHRHLYVYRKKREYSRRMHAKLTGRQGKDQDWE